MTDADMMNAYGARKIVTWHCNPPIPDRSHDWAAYFEGEEENGHYGWGRTEAAAIQDFIENCADEDDHQQLMDALEEMNSDNGQFGVGA